MTLRNHRTLTMLQSLVPRRKAIVIVHTRSAIPYMMARIEYFLGPCALDYITVAWVYDLDSANRVFASANCPIYIDHAFYDNMPRDLCIHVRELHRAHNCR